MTRQMTRQTLKGILLGALFLASPAIMVTSTTASATTFAEMTTEQFTDASSLIVEGTITEVWTSYNEEKSRITTHAKMTITRTHKGIATEEIVIDSHGGTYGDLSENVEGMAKFSEGEEVFMFLYTTPTGRHVPVSKFLGKYTVRRAPGESVNYVRRWHPKRVDRGHFDHRFLPHPAPESRVYLEDLRTQVNARLDKGWDGEPIPGLNAEQLQTINTPTWRLRK